ncbi:MAG: hypothetical protein WBP45_03950 [Daejeonella sp.]
MAISLYNPFTNLNFSKNVCFISGRKLQAADEEISVFPLGLMQRYDLRNKSFKLLDESISTYGDLKLPCDPLIFEQIITPLEEEIEQAFLAGYAEVNKLPKLKLFQWIAKLVYGILFNEIRIGINQQQVPGEEFVLSQGLIHKFTNLHVMLQSLTNPLVFEGSLPFTIHVFKVNNATDNFNYRDEINTLTFSLGLKDFGIIACLQDNLTNSVYHKTLLDKVKDQTLHPIQYEELCAKFFYSNYLFNRLPEYTIISTDEAVYIEPMSLRGTSNKPLFDNWQNKTYAQVLENFWKPWGFTLFEILKDPENPMTHLLDGSEEFIPADTIPLPS